MAYRQPLVPGDRVAYTAAFVRQLGCRYEDGQRRGTFLSYRPGDDLFGFVRWDDENLSQHDHDPEYREHVRELGMMICLANICKPESCRFGDIHAK
jgi:hypothetical protein